MTKSCMKYDIHGKQTDDPVEVIHELIDCMERGQSCIVRNKASGKYYSSSPVHILRFIENELMSNSREV